MGSFGSTELCLLGASFLLAGCSGGASSAAPGSAAAPPAAAAPRPAPTAEGPASRVAALTYEVEMGGKKGRFPSPLVRGQIGGRSTLMLLDSGASGHVIAGWLAKSQGLETEAGEIGRDIAGASEARIAREPRFVIEGLGEVAKPAAFVVELGEVFQALGIGAVLSPQLLGAPDDLIELDLRKGELRVARGEPAAGGGGVEAASGMQACSSPGRVETLLYVIDASIDGVAARLLVDTGATKTKVFEASPAGRALLARAKGGADGQETVAASGAKVKERKAAGARLAVGKLARELDVDVGPAPSGDAACPRDGRLGMDVLARCTLRMCRATLSILCDP